MANGYEQDFRAFTSEECKRARSRTFAGKRLLPKSLCKSARRLPHREPCLLKELATSVYSNKRRGLGHPRRTNSDQAVYPPSRWLG